MKSFDLLNIPLYPTETVNTCRRCAAELSESGEMLKSIGGVVVRVMRETESVLAYRYAIPSNIRETAEEAWERRKPSFCTSHSYNVASHRRYPALLPPEWHPNIR